MPSHLRTNQAETKRIVLLYSVPFVVPMGIYPMGNSGPQGKPAATEWRNPTLTIKRMLGLFVFP